MTSKQPAACCYTGLKHEGNPRGRIDNVGEAEAYLTEPPSDITPNGYGILYLTDIIGHKLVNAQLIADQFADNGYIVLMPDLFHGDPVPFNVDMSTFSLPKWYQGEYGPDKIPHLPSTVDPIVNASIEKLFNAYKCKKIALVGYCFGAKYVVRFLGGGRVSAGFVAHPAGIDQGELEAMKGPLAIAAAETDAVFPENLRHESEVTLKKLGSPYQINLYSGVTHGFAVKCDLSQRVQKYAKESAFLFALQWFEEHLSGD